MKKNIFLIMAIIIAFAGLAGCRSSSPTNSENGQVVTKTGKPELVYFSKKLVQEFELTNENHFPVIQYYLSGSFVLSINEKVYSKTVVEGGRIVRTTERSPTDFIFEHMKPGIYVSYDSRKDELKLTFDIAGADRFISFRPGKDPDRRYIMYATTSSGGAFTVPYNDRTYYVSVMPSTVSVLVDVQDIRKIVPGKYIVPGARLGERETGSMNDPGGDRENNLYSNGENVNNNSSVQTTPRVFNNSRSQDDILGVDEP